MAKVKEIYLYLAIYMVIYIEFGYQMVVANQVSGFLRMMMLLIFTIPVLFYTHKVEKRPLVYFSLIICYIFANVLRDDALFDYIFLLIPIFVGAIFAMSIEVEDFVKIYGNIMLFLSIYSLVVYAINIFFPALIQRLPFLSNVYTYAAEIHNAFFAVAITNSEIVRNYGIAWEPGAFSLLVCVALIFETTFYRNINYKRVLIFIITIITTFSTSGYIAMFGILYACLFYKRKFTKKEKNILCLMFCLMIVFVLTTPDQIMNLVFDKLNGLFSGGELAYTTQSRLNAIKYPLQAFFSSPFTGVGFEKFMIINRTLCDSVATNTIINWYAVLGMFLGLPCCIGLFSCLYKIAKRINAPKINAVILCVAMTLLLSTESLLRISLVYILVFWGFSQRKIEGINQIE